MELIEQETKRPEYKWYRDSKMKATIVLIFIVVIMIFGFLKVPVLTTIHSYTIGAMMGYYAPLFYLFAILQCIKVIFDNKFVLPTWVKVNKLTYWIIVVAIIAVGTSLGFYQGKDDSYTVIGTKAWNTFGTWWSDWTDNGEANGWYPNNTNGGIIGAFYYSFTAMCTSGIGSMVISFLVLAVALSIIGTGSFFELYKSLIRKSKHDKHQKFDQQNTITAIPIADPEIEETPGEKEKQEFLPFDDPF